MDKVNLTQVGRAVKQLGIAMIPAYSPEARGRSERAFATHQARLPKELQLAGITHMAAANRYLQEVYRPAFNEEFAQSPCEAGSAFVPFLGGNLEDILCEHYERTVGKDNCVHFEGQVLFTCQFETHPFKQGEFRALQVLGAYTWFTIVQGVDYESPWDQ